MKCKQFKIYIMKNKLLMLFGFIIASITSFNAQIQFYQSFDDSSSQGCTQTANFLFGIGNLDEVGATITIDWADGNMDTYPLPTYLANAYGEFSVAHSYAVPGNYTVNASVFSAVSNTTISGGAPINFTSVSPAACGFFWGYVSGNGLPFNSNVPLDATGADGTTITLYPNLSMNGMYIGLNPLNGPYTVTVNPQWLLNNGYIQSNPAIVINTFDSNGMGNPGQLTFALTCANPAGAPDISAHYGYVWNMVAPLQTGNLNLNVCNLACQDTSNVQVSVVFPAGYVPNLSGLTNASVNPNNVLTFDLLDLSSCTNVWIQFTFPGNTPAGTQVCFPVNYTATGDSDVSNNTDTICGVVLNSYDPNDKQSSQPAQIDPSVQDKFTYLIRFQNDGNFNAVNVVVVDSIDVNLDLSTFNILESKHNVVTTIDPVSRVITFNFQNCNLTPFSTDSAASQGFVSFEIMENVGNGIGTSIENTASIYFDFNPAIVTNTTVSVNNVLSISESIQSTTVLFPVPAENELNVKNSSAESYSIVSLNGQQLSSGNITSEGKIDVSLLSSGVYLLQLVNDNSFETIRFVKK